MFSAFMHWHLLPLQTGQCKLIEAKLRLGMGCWDETNTVKQQGRKKELLERKKRIKGWDMDSLVEYICSLRVEINNRIV
jgi:hypothetical protein